MHVRNLILGGGLAGLSASYHIGHNHCLILEATDRPFGHIKNTSLNGFTFDQGPHVSFTKDPYVIKLFAESVNGEFQEYPVRTRNFFKGHWIDHPAQSNLYQIPEPLRTECLQSFRHARSKPPPEVFESYQQWMDFAFGKVFAENFAAAYTRKYWTVEPSNLGVDWIGKRVYFPDQKDVVEGSKGPLPEQTHYITHVRYPTSGGYQSFAKKLEQGARLILRSCVHSVNLEKRTVIYSTAAGGKEEVSYDRLISTLPLPVFIKTLTNATMDVLEATENLQCSQLLLVDLMAPHETQIEGNWFYVYDENMNSTRIHCTEVLSPNNAPPRHTGIEIEVYANPRSGFKKPHNEIADNVRLECEKMGFLKAIQNNETTCETVTMKTRFVPYANVICDHNRKPSLEIILSYLSNFGLEREDGDLDAYTDWQQCSSTPSGKLIFAGRFAQWKYFWTDDCVLRGKNIPLIK